MAAIQPMQGVVRPILGTADDCFGSLFPIDRRLSAYGTQQNQLHQHNLVTESWKLSVANHRQTVMRSERVEFACAMRIRGL
jgi:hypothetical protein